MASLGVQFQCCLGYRGVAANSLPLSERHPIKDMLLVEMSPQKMLKGLDFGNGLGIGVLISHKPMTL